MVGPAAPLVSLSHLTVWSLGFHFLKIGSISYGSSYVLLGFPGAAGALLKWNLNAAWIVLAGGFLGWLLSLVF